MQISTRRKTKNSLNCLKHRPQKLIIWKKNRVKNLKKNLISIRQTIKNLKLPKILKIWKKDLSKKRKTLINSFKMNQNLLIKEVKKTGIWMMMITDKRLRARRMN